MIRLVVGADGANSQVRKLGGFGSWGWGYGQEAVVCTVKVTPRDTVKRPEGDLTHLPPSHMIAPISHFVLTSPHPLTLLLLH